MSDAALIGESLAPAEAKPVEPAGETTVGDSAQEVRTTAMGAEKPLPTPPPEEKSIVAEEAIQDGHDATAVGPLTSGVLGYKAPGLLK